VPAQNAGEDSVLFESNKGVVLRYAGLRAWDARGRILPSQLEVGGSEIRLLVEDHSAQYPVIIDPFGTQQQELTASDGAANDSFGISVSVSGDTAVIGAPGKSNAGTTYVEGAFKSEGQHEGDSSLEFLLRRPQAPSNQACWRGAGQQTLPLWGASHEH